MAFLDGYRVLEFTDDRGLMAGRILADLGADVVQVEPPGGSPARQLLPRSSRDGQSYIWQAYAANKRGVELDLDQGEDRANFEQLLSAADVLIESFGPKHMSAFGLDWEQIKERYPHLVYVSITPFGRSGPKAGYADSDLVVWAAGGPLDPHRDGDLPPVRPSIPQAYRQASADAAAGALLALTSRRKTGRGQLVDISAQACLGISTLGSVLAYAIGDRVSKKDALSANELTKRRIDQSGSGSGSSAASKKWRAKDGVIEFHIGVGPAVGAFTGNFFKWMLAEGAPVDRFAGLDWRTVPQMMESGEFTDDDVDEARSAVAAFLAEKTMQEVLEAAVKYRLLSVPIYTTADLATSPQLVARELYTEVGEGDRRIRFPGPPAKVSAEAYRLDRPAPLLGEHTDEVLSEWSSPSARSAELVVGNDAPSLPLEGLKVLDLTWVVAGPVVGRALADFGATVVRVESSTRVETARFMPPFVEGNATPESSGLYLTWNAGKLGMTLNLQDERGREIVRELAKWADVVLEAFSPGTMSKWGLDYAALSAENPGLIMMSSSINGQTGPAAPLAGFGNVGAALSGFQAVVGYPDRAPFGPYGPYTDFVGPRMGLPIFLAALDERERTGKGSYIDLSQVESGVFFQSPEMAAYFGDGRVVNRMGNDDLNYAPNGVFRSKSDAEDGAERYVAITAVTDEQWRALATWAGRPDLAADPELMSVAGRQARKDEIAAAIGEATAKRTPKEAEIELQALGVPAHVSASSKDFCTDEQLQYRKHLVTLPHPLFGNVTVEGPRYLLSETPGGPRRSAPTFGQDNDYVLTQILGKDQATIDALAQEGVLR